MPKIISSKLAVCDEKPLMSVRIGVINVNAAKLAPKPVTVIAIMARISGRSNAASCVTVLPASGTANRGTQIAVAAHAITASPATA